MVDQQLDGTEPWEVLWCQDAWLSVADRVEQLLPSWAVLKRLDASRPLLEQVHSARVLIPCTNVLGEDAINAASHLRLIAQPAAGYDGISIAAAKKRGVPVTTAPGFNSDSVAEVALMMMLMLMRRVDEARIAFATQQAIGEPAHSKQLCGKVLGIIGLGRIGQRLARAAQGLGMEVISTSSSSTRADLHHLLRASDVVSLHCPLTDATRGLLGHEELAMMRPGAVLLNSARGQVIVKEAALSALVSGQLGGLGLDVHWVEPADPDDPLYQHPRTLALPHLGCICEEVYNKLAQLLVENICRVREGRELLHRLC